MKDSRAPSPIRCKACGHTWTPRKPKHSPRYRCPVCFRLVHPGVAKKYQAAAALAMAPGSA